MNSAAVNRRNPAALLDATGNHHSQISIVEPGRLAFVSGQVAMRPDGEPPPDGLEDQAQIVVGNLTAALTDPSAGPEDIVSVRVYVVDGTQARFEAAWPAFVALFDGAMPSATVVGVTALAAPALLIEAEMVVRIPDTAR